MLSVVIDGDDWVILSDGTIMFVTKHRVVDTDMTPYQSHVYYSGNSKMFIELENGMYRATHSNRLFIVRAISEEEFYDYQLREWNV